jgi:hypothetical protein
MSKTLLTTSKATHIEMSNCLAHEHFIHLTRYIYHKWHYKQITIYLTKKLVKKKKKTKKWHLSTWSISHIGQVDFDMSNLIEFSWLGFFTRFFYWAF